MRLYVNVLIMFLLLLAGCGTPSFLITPVASEQKLSELEIEPGKGFAPSKVAVIELEGMLINARSGGLLQPGENKLSLFIEQLNKAAADNSVKAIVLRVNSPGGTVTCADNMYDMVQKFRTSTHKPVVASAQEICASGAYYVACGSDVIMANPTSIVGSIGVIFDTFDISDLMAKIGVRTDPIKSAPLKDMGSPFKPLDPEARTVMQGMIDEYFKRFVGIVTSNRPKLSDPAQIKLATDGRVFSGDGALAIGLIDRVGRLDDAIALAKKMGKAPGAKVVMYRRSFAPSGSIYTETNVDSPKAQNIYNFNLGDADLMLPRGFYYMWTP